MLALSLEAQYEGEDGVHERGKVYPIVAITLYDEIEDAAQCLVSLMGENDWNEICIKKYGAIKQKANIPNSVQKNENWEKQLAETGAIYIVYK